MKKFLISAIIYYVLLSLFVAFIWMLTGITGNIALRGVIALVLAFLKPISLKPRW